MIATGSSKQRLAGLLGSALLLGAVVLLALVPSSGAASFPATELASRGAGVNGAGADKPSASPSISADGRYVAFVSSASNILPGVHGRQAYRRDMQTGQVVLVSRADGADGAPAPDAYATSISADGRYVAFTAPGTLGSAATDTQVFVRDIDSGTTTLASRATGATGAVSGYASDPVISADGRHVAFVSTGQLTVDASAGSFNAFVRDLDANVTANVHVPAPGGHIDASGATAVSYLSISSDGSKVAFSSGQALTADDDSEGSVDVFVRDRTAGTTTRITPPGPQTPCRGDYPSISANGRFVAYEDCADRIAVTDLTLGTTERISAPIDVSGPGTPPSLSADGVRVAYVSASKQASPVKGSGKNIFVYNDAKGVTVNASRASGQGVPANAGSNAPMMAGGGGFVAFLSLASNLSDADSDRTNDIFRRQLSFAPDKALPVCGKLTVTQLGTNGKDVLVGTDRRDVIDGMGGNDVIKGLAGADVLCGGAGKDVVNGGADNTGSSPYDLLYGGPGRDRLKLVEGGGTAHGGPGNDLVVGSNTHDSGDNLDGGVGNDVLLGLSNADYNPDYLRGGPGDDDLFGGADDDVLSGQNGNDRLFGGTGDDRLNGGAGHDLLDFGPQD